MKLASFVICEKTEISNDNKTRIINPLQMIVLNNFPNNYTFSVSFGLFDTPKTNFKLFIEILKGEKSFGVVEGEVAPGIELLKNAKYGIQINLDFNNFSFEEAGTYVFRISDENGVIGDFGMEVVYVTSAIQ